MGKAPHGPQASRKAAEAAEPVPAPDEPGATRKAPGGPRKAANGAHAPGGAAAPRVTARAGKFATADGCLSLSKFDKGAEIFVALANFDARIVGDLELDDAGGEQRRIYTVRAELRDGSVLTPDVPAADFSSTRWVDLHLGARANVLPPLGAANLGAAIKALSQVDGLKPATAAAHVGYRTHNGGAAFITGEAVLASPGCDVTGLAVILPPACERFALPAAPSGMDLKAALAASAAVLGAGPLSITLPLWLFTYRAALPVEPPDYVVWVVGPTGAYKSAFAGVLQSHFGAGWDGTHLPGNWQSTLTSLEGVAYNFKNALCVLDDFRADDARARQEMERAASRLVRGVGNRSARQRSTADLRQRPQRAPRGAVMVTAEDRLLGHSLSARMLVLEIASGDIKASELTLRQRDARAGLLAGSMSGFISWLLAQGCAQIERRFHAASDAHRDAAVRKLQGGAGSHARTPGIAADLLAAAGVLIEFYAANGVGLPFDAASAQDTLLGSAEKQAKEIASANPVEIAREALGVAIRSGMARIADRARGERPRDGGRWGWSRDFQDARPVPVIGCADLGTEPVMGGTMGETDKTASTDTGAPTRVSLFPSEAFAAITEVLRREGRELGIGRPALWRLLVAEKLVAPGPNGPSTVKNFAGRAVRVLDAAMAVLTTDDVLAAEKGENGAAPSPAGGVGGEAAPDDDSPF